MTRYDLVTYECGLSHRTYFLLEPKSKATTRGEIKQWMGELARKYVETYDKEIIKELY
jgi:hypothetical protein